MSSGFRFDLNLCTGCSACELACSIENQLGWGHSWRQVVAFNEQKLPSISTYHLSLACNHCTDAPCVSACPALAIERNERTGAVLIEPTHCIGCRYCSWACPYEAPVFDDRAQVMGKCTWCDHRLTEGLKPACVEQCPTLALTFGPLEGAESVAGFPETSASPAIRFVPLEAGRRQGPECSWEIPQEVVESFASSRPQQTNEISLRSEWPLWVFTLLVSVLVGWILAAVGGRIPPDPKLFLGLAVGAGAASTLHLGMKSRAWRALLNFRQSWLSREVVFFALFVAASVTTMIFPSWVAMEWAAAIFGLLTLFSVDRVYDPVRPSSGHPMHSADTVLTGILVAALVLDFTPLALTVMAVKLALYTARHLRRLGSTRGTSRPLQEWLLAGLRVGLGLVLPILLWAFEAEGGALWAAAAIAIGEILDRAEFYNELEKPSLGRQAAIDLALIRSQAPQAV